MVTHPSRVNLDSHPLALFIQQKELHHLNLESSIEEAKLYTTTSNDWGVPRKQTTSLDEKKKKN